MPIGHVTRHTKLKRNENSGTAEEEDEQKSCSDNIENGENILLIISAVYALSQLAPCSKPLLFCIEFLASLFEIWNFLHHSAYKNYISNFLFFYHVLSLCFSFCLKFNFSISLPRSSHPSLLASTFFFSPIRQFSFFPIHRHAFFMQPVLHSQMLYTYIEAYHKTQRHSVQCLDCVASSEWHKYLIKLLIQLKIHIMHCLRIKGQALFRLFISYTGWIPKKILSFCVAFFHKAVC